MHCSDIFYRLFSSIFSLVCGYLNISFSLPATMPRETSRETPRVIFQRVYQEVCHKSNANSHCPAIASIGTGVEYSPQSSACLLEHPIAQFHSAESTEICKLFM